MNPFVSPVRLTGMKTTIIRYRTKPDRTEENRRLIEAVFAEIHNKKPSGLRYVSLALGEGGFVHLVERDDDAPAMQTFEAFQAFQEGIEDRCAEPPEFAEVSIVGNYRMLL